MSHGIDQCRCPHSVLHFRVCVPQVETPFGGLNVVLVGDFGQLPPCAGTPLYRPARPSDNSMGHSGSILYKAFNKVVVLQKVMRVDDNEDKADVFKKNLSHLRNGEIMEDMVTDPVYNMILKRRPPNPPPSDFDDCVHVWYLRAPVRQHNLTKLKELAKPVAIIHAVHQNTQSAKADPRDAMNLEPILYLAIGARVMYVRNSWQDGKLVNGAKGTVVSIIYKPDDAPPALPECVIVQFDEYIGPSFLPSIPRCVAVTPYTCNWVKKVGSKNVQFDRTQLPLTLAFALTLYKIQGQTLPKLWWHPGDREWATGAYYVAISRVRKVSDVLVDAHSHWRYDFDIIQLYHTYICIAGVHTLLYILMHAWLT